MRSLSPNVFAVSVLLALSVLDCDAAAGAPASPPLATLAGVVVSSDGAPAAGGSLAISSADDGKLVRTVAAGPDGRYDVQLPTGNYALAVATSGGFAWLDKVSVPNAELRITLATACQRLVGHLEGKMTAGRVQVQMERQSHDKGDTFITSVGSDGGFVVCLPEGQYRASLTGNTLSKRILVDLDAPTSLRIEGFAASDIKRAPRSTTRFRAAREGLVADIIASNAKLIGLGEATHGTGEFVAARGELTFELIRHAGVRLLLVEFDAIASVALDNYVNGGDVDLDVAIPALGFWITDTYEFRKFLEDLRTYNATTTDKVHLWGIDAQDTTLPVNVLIADADQRGMTGDEQAVLKRMTKRAKAVRELSADERAHLDSLLLRLAVPRSKTQHDLLVALAAKSLALQLDYWHGDMPTWYRKRRDLAMADLTHFIVDQAGAKRAVIWAHAAHITKEATDAALGHHLAVAEGGYYAVGFYLYQGITRAVDEASKIGVISHAIPVAPPYTVESVIMTAAGMPAIAWVPVRRSPAWLTQWLAMPRYVREVYATYLGADGAMILRDDRAAFDGVVVIQRGHDSSPTPTGVRVFDRK